MSFFSLGSDTPAVDSLWFAQIRAQHTEIGNNPAPSPQDQQAILNVEKVERQSGRVLIGKDVGPFRNGAACVAHFDISVSAPSPQLLGALLGAGILLVGAGGCSMGDFMQSVSCAWRSGKRDAWVALAFAMMSSTRLTGVGVHVPSSTCCHLSLSHA